MIVVSGATGNVGRPLVQALAAAGEQVTAVSRREAQVPDGVTHLRADLAEPETMRKALDGADAVFLLVAGDDPYGLLDAAKAGGVRRVVLLSSQGAGTRPDVYRHPRAFEEAVQRSGMDWTVLRPGGFHTNAFAWAETIRAHRTAAAPFADVALPSIDPADIAEVAAAVLREEGHAGRTYELTGPAAIAPRERARAIGDALGEPVAFVEQTREEAREQMLRFMPEPVVEGTLAILGEPAPAERQVSPDVERVIGRAPHTFADWAARNVAAFR
ncbi:NmrA family transcriptional regulator [Planotetraspora thailandica]|uniref:NmrA family transcriptional regulator n=1 Tax=Planotetraspora thailandica TaxID=487172 RepID=A0A8J4DDB1_9ACTN|nr:NAD(P)H-binding protein [Planotetraspora thailandica]GII58306.1 NmrA family transcriptional regulator [Planotetraspora thailandica]